MLDWILLGVMFVILCGVIFWVEYAQAKWQQFKDNGYKSLPDVSSNTPMPPVKPPKKSCGNCKTCKCNTKNP